MVRIFASTKAKILLEDFIAPFVLGVFLTSALMWAASSKDREVEEPLEAFRDRSGQLNLVRHGIQEKEEDLHREGKWKDELQFGVIADASNGFKKFRTRKSQSKNKKAVAALEENYIDPEVKPEAEKSKRNVMPVIEVPTSSPGEIWSWPRLEKESTNEPLVWVVTPTYRNPYQHADLMRTAQALYPARKFVRWLVVDDSSKSRGHPNHLKSLDKFLGQLNVNFTLMKSKKRKSTERSLFKPKGVDARRTAIEYIRTKGLKGVVYFADDDNTYDSDIFRQMQATKTVSIWPTGAITQVIVSGPVVNESGVVVDFFDGWVANRKFPVDFASFAVNADLLHENPTANIPWIQGYEETVFLKTLNVKKETFQPLAANATEVMSWHTKTFKNHKLQDPAVIKEILKEKSEWSDNIRNLLDKYDFVLEGQSKTNKTKKNNTDKVKRKEVREEFPGSDDEIAVFTA